MEYCFGLDREWTEEELIEKAINEDGQSFSVLFNQYRPVIYKTRKKYHIHSFDLDDWLQEGQIVFMETLKSYNIEKSVTLGAYFKINFERHACNLLRHQQALKRKGESESLSLEYCMESTGDQVFQCREDTVCYEESVELREILSGFVPLLSELETEMLYVELGLTYLGVTQVDNSETCRKNAKSRMKRKLKDFLKCQKYN